MNAVETDRALETVHRDRLLTSELLTILNIQEYFGSFELKTFCIKVFYFI